MQKLTRFQLT